MVSKTAFPEDTKTAREWGGFESLTLVLNDEGVFTALHAHFQALNLPLLLLNEEIFYPA